MARYCRHCKSYTKSMTFINLTCNLCVLTILSCCCCCCQVASVVSNSVWPHRRQPIRLPCSWDSPGKNTGVGCHFLLQCRKVKVKVKSLSRVRLLATSWTAAYQAPPSMGFSRQEYWSGVPLPSPHFIMVPSKMKPFFVSMEKGAGSQKVYLQFQGVIVAHSQS